MSSELDPRGQDDAHTRFIANVLRDGSHTVQATSVPGEDGMQHTTSFVVTIKETPRHEHPEKGVRWLGKI